MEEIDKRRVFFLMVLECIREVTAEEHAQEKKRARRAAQSQKQHRVGKRYRESPTLRRQSSSNLNRAVIAAKPQPTLEEQKLHISRWLDSIPDPVKQPGTEEERERKALIRRLLQSQDSASPSRPLAPRPAFEPVDEEARADKYEAQETDAELVETRRRIRAQPGLSDLCKIVLLLTTQLPYGVWTTYKAMQDHLIRIRRGCPIYEIGQFLAQNPLGRAVPCHRVIARAGGFGKPMELGSHYEDREEMLELLLEEGMEIRADGSPKVENFVREFVGCPRV